jgi:hypothetical protein
MILVLCMAVANSSTKASMEGKPSNMTKIMTTTTRRGRENLLEVCMQHDGAPAVHGTKSQWLWRWSWFKK